MVVLRLGVFNWFREEKFGENIYFRVFNRGEVCFFSFKSSRVLFGEEFFLRFKIRDSS